MFGVSAVEIGDRREPIHGWRGSGCVGLCWRVKLTALEGVCPSGVLVLACVGSCVGGSNRLQRKGFGLMLAMLAALTENPKRGVCVSA
jgi:hypothetical protein